VQRPGPLADSHPGAVALVVCSLVPYLVLIAAVLPLAKTIGASLDIDQGTFDLIVPSAAGTPWARSSPSNRPCPCRLGRPLMPVGSTASSMPVTGIPRASAASSNGRYRGDHNAASTASSSSSSECIRLRPLPLA
jgi:hypothetical protein